ncbi:transcriptional regulator, TetR family [Labilithrix luteola]|uniref:Transcriptional regulator, TetR family n=1 Tax=Labilithrix luteola TaxID=1391654 RepID=A0A0K1Q4F0_9BACT|nr:TetR/AcrR family transcriptional regulator [Labilithrix luteola]AKV00613.1 transcriptional regulator, TetR family [Labilithrix luteola]
MQDEGGLRERKKRETRKRISDVATALFMMRGFDAVTVLEVAEAANVSKMTVFNYFPRKEDMFFDRDEESRELIRQALLERRKGTSPLSALRSLVRRLVEERHPFAKFDAGIAGFWKTVTDSAALTMRAREMRGELERDLAELLVASAGGRKPDPRAKLLAGMIASAGTVAYAEGLRRVRAGESSARARKAFVALLERCFRSVAAGFADTPYV